MNAKSNLGPDNFGNLIALAASLLTTPGTMINSPITTAGGMIKLYVSALVAAITVQLPAYAADNKGNYIVHGEGNVSCGAWATNRRDGAWFPEGAWVQGFVTAYNFYVYPKSDVASGTDADGIAAWMDGYCAAHPLDSVAHGAERLVLVLRVRSSGGSLENEYGP